MLLTMHILIAKKKREAVLSLGENRFKDMDICYVCVHRTRSWPTKSFPFHLSPRPSFWYPLLLTCCDLSNYPTSSLNPFSFLSPSTMTRIDIRVVHGSDGPAGRVGSGRAGSGRVTILPDFGGSGRVGSALRIYYFLLIISWYLNRYDIFEYYIRIDCFSSIFNI